MKKNKNALPALEQAIKNLPDIYQKYFNWLRSYSKPNTIKTYLHNLKKAEQLLGKPLIDCSKEDFISFKAVLNDEKKWLGKTSTANAMLSAIQSFIGYCIDEEIIDKNPIPRKFSFPKDNNMRELTIFNHHLEDLRKMLKDQVVHISDSIRRYGGDRSQVMIALQKRLAVNMLIDLGCRLGELLAVTKSEIFTQKAMIDGKEKEYTMCRVFIFKKTGIEPGTKIFPLSEETRDALSDYLDKAPPEVRIGTERLFLVKERQMQRYIEDVKEDFNKLIEDSGVKFTAHSFRHLFSTRLSKANINGYQVQKFMGHSNIQSPSRYVHVEISDSIAAFERMKQCVN